MSYFFKNARTMMTFKNSIYTAITFDEYLNNIRIYSVINMLFSDGDTYVYILLGTYTYNGRNKLEHNKRSGYIDNDSTIVQTLRFLYTYNKTFQRICRENGDVDFSIVNVSTHIYEIGNTIRYCINGKIDKRKVDISSD